MSIGKLVMIPALLAAVALAPPVSAQSVVAAAKPVPAAVAAGPADSTQPMRITVWLKMHDSGGFTAALQQLYDPQSPQYRQWLSAGDIAKYAPTVAEVSAVKTELQAGGLTLLEDDPARLSVRAQGTLAAVQSLFHTSIGAYQQGGRTFYANTTPATLGGAAGELVLSVSGLDNFEAGSGAGSHVPAGSAASVSQATFALARPSDSAQATSAGSGIADFVTEDCFHPPQTVSFGSPSSTPYASFTGNLYDAGSKFCGLPVSRVLAAYGMDEAHERGLRGQGQTVVLIEIANPPTLLADVNAFSHLNGLPEMTGSSLQVIAPEGPPLVANQPEQVSADVEWVHAMAPDAHIVVLLLPAADDEDLQYGIYYAATQRLGSVISFDFNSPETDYGPLGVQAYDQVIALAAASGINVDVPTGDLLAFALQTPVGNLNVPGDSPHATAIGGTSLGIPDGKGGTTEVGYGITMTLISEPGAQPGNPVALQPGFESLATGTQGGESVLFAKPAFQAALPGSGRLVPDVAVTAGFVPGLPIVLTDSTGVQVIERWSGTEAACPIFSGIWALANQRAHHWLGQAAPAIAHMPAGALHDIVPVGSDTNPAGIYVNASGTPQTFAPPDFFAVNLPVPAEFFSAMGSDKVQQIVNTPDSWFVAGWGLGGMLTTAPGWDYLTGFGSPNGMAFLDAAAHQRGDE